MKNAFGQRALVWWALAQLALAFALVLPFSLSPIVWVSLLALCGVEVLCARSLNQKLPRVCAKTLWVLTAVIRWALVAYVVYAVFFFAPEATVGYTAESRASIFAATLVPLFALCAVTLPSQAMVADRSVADARRVTLTAFFSLIVAGLLYAVEPNVIRAAVWSLDGVLGHALRFVAVAVAVAVFASAGSHLLAQKTK